MQEEWLKGILETIDSFKKNVPEGDVILNNTYSMSIEELLKRLNELFKLEEEAIKKEHSKLYVTDNYENNVKNFATKLIIAMVSCHKQLKEYEDYRKLLGQRHISYGFYNAFYNAEDINEYQGIIQEPFFKTQLYLGLVEFYQNFYGKFSDNEEAIKLLCKFYPKDIDLSKNKGSIASAIFKHITNAGTPSDFGFAYNGIELIRKYIGNLPIEIIDELLKKYELYKIINEKIYRHQIFTIIENSIIDSNDKIKYKFSYLDSVILANNMNRSLYEKYWKNEADFVPQYIPFETDMSVENIVLIKHVMNDSDYAYWTNICSLERYFIVDKKKFIKISLNSDKKEIWIKYTDKLTTMVKFEFNYIDWMLDDYNSKEAEQKLQDFVFEANDGKNEIIYNNLTFSLAYLNNYRGVTEQLVDFDHKFSYDKTSNELRKSDIVSSVIPHFYGNKVYSLSCIVGKNGTGKTSTMDFLRGTFFKLLRLIGEYGINCENGYVREVDYEPYGILDKGCEFLVVFHLGSQPYYLTNIKDITVKIAKSFSLSDYKSVNELSKVVYFSNMLSISQDKLYTDESILPRYESSENKLAKSLSNFRQVDYSEAASFIQKRKAIDAIKQKDNSTTVVNKELCYQLAFLDYLTKEKLEYYFDMPVDKKFTLKSVLLGIDDVLITVFYSLKDMISEEPQKLKLFLTSPDAKIEYFSSGQYAKFSFLAKLYWFLEGYQKYIQDFESMVGANVFSRDEALSEGETALIFIDEGELYYHPEWQRSYIKTLIDNIHDAKIESKLQVVITTNSPFIISDILSNDITYLSKEEEDFDRTFGQNIHKLLKDNFFMSYTIGEYSRQVIESIMKWLNNEGNYVGEELSAYFGKTIEPKDYYEKIRCLIDKIGEPIYREKLLDMLNESKFCQKHEYEMLLRQMSEIKRKLKVLEGEAKL